MATLQKTITLTRGDEAGNVFVDNKIPVVARTALAFDSNGNTFCARRSDTLEKLEHGRQTNVTEWDLLPVITAVTAASDKFFILSGANTPVASRSAKGALTVTTGATNTNAGVIVGLAASSFRPVISATNLVSVVGRFMLGVVSGTFFNFGIDQAPSTTDPTVITGTDFARFIFDPTNVLASGITTYATNFIAVVRGSSGTVTYYDTGVAAVINVDYKLRIDVSAALIPTFYINDVLVATSAIVLAATTQIVHAGAEVISGSAVVSFDCRYIRVGREMGV